ncbi:right-handed parallel beta-helix repeat-containing protein [Singulisphaera sp. Ch08]|uniref:Right-handed parallel beta-helix repeat-containing protein n=1 Tax=Singulisphaera sp. Ch08 TaxID=3120278 RepID=A0AAU7C8S2_9BACT
MKPLLITIAIVVSGYLPAQAQVAGGRTVLATNTTELREALAEAKPGTTIRIAAGTYAGGLFSRTLQGEPGNPIVLTAADPEHPPVIDGGTVALHLSSPAYVEIRQLVITKSTGNGLSIDDGGSLDHPAHHLVLHGLVVREIGPKGNRDGIKLSGVDDFLVENCTIERWGSGGSGIDMVGCHRGKIVDCTFRYEGNLEANGVQAKGGSRDILVQRSRFEHAGSRAVNVGGSTGLAYFRPKAPGYEAKDITVEDCTFLGSQTPIAFVGVDGALVRHNTIYCPSRWAFRILQENKEPGFVASRGGRFTDNIITYRSAEMGDPVNIGPNTSPETFVMARNAWYSLDAPARSRPKLTLEEVDGIYGTDPQFHDAANGDLRLRPESRLAQFGVRADSKSAVKSNP